MIAHMAFQDPKIGTNKVDLGGGYTLKYVNGIDTRLDEASFNLIREELPDHIVDKCIKFKPSLIMKGLKDLNEHERELLDEAIITKPKTPTLEIVPPKPQ